MEVPEKAQGAMMRLTAAMDELKELGYDFIMAAIDYESEHFSARYSVDTTDGHPSHTLLDLIREALMVSPAGQGYHYKEYDTQTFKELDAQRSPVSEKENEAAVRDLMEFIRRWHNRNHNCTQLCPPTTEPKTPYIPED